MHRLILVLSLCLGSCSIANAAPDRDGTFMAMGFIAGVWEAEQYHLYSERRDAGLSHEAAWASVNTPKCNDFLNLSDDSIRKLVAAVDQLLAEDKRPKAYLMVAEVAQRICNGTVN